MKYWIISDTHFGHENIKRYENRPDNCDEKMMHNIKEVVGCSDVLIHLGDVALRDEKFWHDRLGGLFGVRRILVRGNHDSRSLTWYYERGWDFVCDGFQLRAHGKLILFTHMPRPDHKADLNIHGHCHSKDPDLGDRYHLIKMEHNYKPCTLRSIVD